MLIAWAIFANIVYIVITDIQVRSVRIHTFTFLLLLALRSCLALTP